MSEPLTLSAVIDTVSVLDNNFHDADKRLIALEHQFATLAKLVNAMRDCVNTQVSMFDKA